MNKVFKINKIMIFAFVLVGLVLIFSNGMGDVSAVTVNDTVQPTITSINPANNAVSVSTNKVVKLTFSEAVKKGSMWIEFKNSKGNAVPFSSNLTGRTLYLTPKTQLAHKTSYTITLHSGCVKDLAGNGLRMQTTKFTTIQTTRTYSTNGVTFNYPSTYDIFTDSGDGNIYVTGIKGYSQSSPNFQLSIVPFPRAMTDQEAIDSVYNVEFPKGYKIISKQIYTLNGNKVYGSIYTINNKDIYPVIMETKEINIIKNHKNYIMDFTAPQKSFANEKIDFNIIAQSLKIK
jgi:hypothetical protein